MSPSGASLEAQVVKNLPAVLETWVQSLGWEIPWRRAWQPIPVFLPGESPGGSAGKESACNEGDLGLIPGLGRFPGEGNSYPLHYSGLENSMDLIVHEVAKSQTRLRHFHFTSHVTYQHTFLGTTVLEAINIYKKYQNLTKDNLEFVFWNLV